MFDYLDKFKKLPAEVQQKISNPAKVKIISSLEEKYRIELAVFTVKVAVSDLPINDLGIHIASEFGLEESRAKALEKEIKEQVFLDVADFLEMDLRGLDKKLVAAYLESKKPKAKPKKVILSLPKTTPKKLLKEAPKFVEKPLFDLPAMPKKNDAYSRQIAEAISDISQVIEKESLISDRVELVKAREILRLYMRGIKSRPETRKVLKDDLNLEHKHIEVILKATTEAKKAITPVVKRPLLDINAAKKNTAQVYNLGKILGHKDEDETKKVLQVGKALKVNKPTILDKPIAKAPAKAVVPVPVKVVVPVAVPVSAPIAAPKSVEKKVLSKAPVLKETPLKVVTQATPSKQKIHDISEVKIMNPIDELRYMDTITFRRLGITAQDSVEKIAGRFMALEKDDFEKKLAGISAWRESPINKLYIKMASMSATSGTPLDKLAADMKAKKEDYLEPEEINALIVLNRSLRF